MMTAVAAFMTVLVMMLMVMLAVVVAVGVTLLRQLAAKERKDLLFDGAGRAGIDLNTRCPKAIHCSATDSPTNQDIYALVN